MRDATLLLTAESDLVRKQAEDKILSGNFGVSEDAPIFGRIAPEQKAQLVEAMLKRGHYVAIISDRWVDRLLALGD